MHSLIKFILKSILISLFNSFVWEKYYNNNYNFIIIFKYKEYENQSILPFFYTCNPSQSVFHAVLDNNSSFLSQFYIAHKTMVKK